jgi:hypothetical protein
VSGNQDSSEGTPAWLSDYQPIEIDVSTLERFAKALQDEVDLNLRPHMAGIFDGLDPATSPFAHRADFLELQNAWYTYGTRKAQTMNVVQSFADATAQLAEAARILAANYRTSDRLAAAKLTDVQQALNQAQHPEAGA